MKLFSTLPFLLGFVLMFGGCASPSGQIFEKLKDAQFKMPKKPASCTKQTAYPRIVRQCRVKVCKGLPKEHCEGGMDDVASAQWISCTKEELLVNGANSDDCRLFVYDLESAMNRRK